ncbi:UNVERIFIED_CONTAM: hypothetical protein HDU68_001629 [Siphonaria sp. JEL0065]|nr:hypothetical protein HDU68_001629 [Siphonaria sp. JEL0065]
MHRTTYQASSIHWQMYATYCFDKFDKLEEFVAADPPTKYLKYFQAQPVNSQLVLSEQKSNNQVAIGVNKRKLEALEDIHIAANRLSERLEAASKLMSEILDDCQIHKRRVVGEVESCKEVETVLQDKAAEIEARENNLSSRAQSGLENCNDDCHYESD